MSPVVRLFVRALLAGVLAAAASLQASADGSSLNSGEVVIAVIAGIVAMAALASAELTTPINPTVGVGKGDSAA